MYTGRRVIPCLLVRLSILAGQSGKKRRHCTTLITQVCLSSTVIQMQGNHLTREAEGHPAEHDWQQPEVPARQYEP